MRFKGTPCLHVMDATSGAEIGRFDSKGYLEIENEKVAARMKRRFMPAPEKQKKAAPPEEKEVS